MVQFESGFTVILVPKGPIFRPQMTDFYSKREDFFKSIFEGLRLWTFGSEFLFEYESGFIARGIEYDSLLAISHLVVRMSQLIKNSIQGKCSRYKLSLYETNGFIFQINEFSILFGQDFERCYKWLGPSRCNKDGFQ